MASEEKFRHPHWTPQNAQDPIPQTSSPGLTVSRPPLSSQVTPRSPRSQQEWDREYMRDIRINLRDLHQPTWGFTIFRTVYTPESDIQFPLFLSKLDAYVKYSIDYELRPNPFQNPSTEPLLDSGPNEEMKKRFSNDVVEDRTLDGASTDDVREAFTKWLVGKEVDIEMHQLYARHRVCIMVDQAVLDSVTAGPEDPGEDYELEDVYVKVIEYLCPEEAEWQAWLKVGLNALCYFWFNVSAGDEVEDMFVTMANEGVDAFTG